METLRVLVVGSGALGLYYGGRLARAGHDVVFLARGENLAALERDGLRVDSIRGDFRIEKPTVARNGAEAVAQGPYDLFLVTLKGPDTRADVLAPLRVALRPGGVVLTLQNGVDSAAHLQPIFGAKTVVGGIAFIGAERTAGGEVAHTAAGHVVFGEPAGGLSERVSRLAETFAAAEVEAKASADLRTEQWRKLVWNAPFNAITALTGRYAHETLAIEGGEELARGAMLEVLAVARALGVELADGVADETLALTKRAGPVRTSMLVDRERGRPLEVDALYGPPVREGARLGVPTPILALLSTLLRMADYRPA